MDKVNQGKYFYIIYIMYQFSEKLEREMVRFRYDVWGLVVIVAAIFASVLVSHV